MLFLQATSDINLKRAAVLKALCIYLGEDDGHLIREYKASHCNCIYQSDVLACIIKYNTRQYNTSHFHFHFKNVLRS